MRYRREIGPFPKPTAFAARKKLAQGVCLCPECRALSPERQAQWERNQQEASSSLRKQKDL